MPTQNSARHATSGASTVKNKVASSAAIPQPIAQPLCIAPTASPRCSARMTSPTSTAAAAHSPPKPNPIRARKANSWA